MSRDNVTDLIRRDELDGVGLSDVSAGETVAPVTLGEVLRLEFMDLLGLSERELRASYR